MKTVTTPTSDSPSEFVRGLREAVPMMIAFVPIGLALGAQAMQKGLFSYHIPLMTGLNFAGGSEFAAIRLWTSPPHILLIVVMSVLINSRHILMGAALAPMMSHLKKSKALVVLFFMCDECWAMGIADTKKQPSGQLSFKYYMGVSAALWSTWVVSSYAGTLLGSILGDVERFGFDMALTAIFLVILRGMWRGLRKDRPWLVSLVAAALTYKFIPGAWYIVVGSLSGLLFALFFGDEHE